MNAQLAMLEENFEKRKTKWTCIEAVKYLFYKFAIDSLCELILCDQSTGIYYIPEIVDVDDSRFEMDLNYLLRITSKQQKQTIFLVLLFFDPRGAINIFINVSFTYFLNSLLYYLKYSF